MTPWAVRLPALVTLLICLPVKLRLNPFSLANAEQELLAGPLTEFEGPRLALWEIAHALEWTALTGFTATLFINPGAKWFLNVPVFVLISLVLVPILTLLASATARLKITQATRLLWHWAGLMAVVALVAAFFVGHGGH
jgi:NADH-quinone oxidoreductase subunit H